MPSVNLPAPELVAIDDLKPHPDNPRRGDVEALRELIRENGWVGHLYRQKSTGYVLSGWHSSRAAKDEGYDALPVVTLDVDDKRAAKLLVSLNRGHELGHTDDAAAAALLRQFADDDDLAGTGWAEDEVDDLLEDGFGTEAADFLSGVGDDDETDGDDEGDGDDAPAASGPEIDAEGADGGPYFTLSYTVTLDEREQITKALKDAKAALGEGATSAQALVEISRAYTDEG